MQKTCPGSKGQSPWPSTLGEPTFPTFSHKIWRTTGKRTLARLVARVGRVICLTRDHGQTKNERKENGKKDRLVTLLTRKTFLHLLQWLWLIQLSLEGENQSMHELYFYWENWDGHFLARAQVSTFFSYIAIHAWLGWEGDPLSRGNFSP